MGGLDENGNVVGGYEEEQVEVKAQDNVD